MNVSVYLRPAGMVWGGVAKSAFEAGAALPLAGGPAYFLAAELIEGTAKDHRRRFISAKDLIASRDSMISGLVQTTSEQRPPLAGLSLERTRIMGIVNITPDSFSDGGDLTGADAAAEHAGRLKADGADIIDIGGESTRPGAAMVEADEELRRVLPLLALLADLGAPISIDTRKPAVMQAATRQGAAIINDISALTYDTSSMEMAAKLGSPVILMHAKGDPRTMQQNPEYDDVVLEVYDYLAARIAAAEAAGIPKSKLVADPGIGFGKTLDHNLALLQNLSIFHGLGVPILVGASRKGFIGVISGEANPRNRVPGSIGVALAAISQGAQILRVHDVKETRAAFRLWRSSMMGRF